MIIIKSFTGSIEEEYIIELAKLRMEVFKDFPYLYEGSMDYEKAYLKIYNHSQDRIIVIAFDGQNIVGASTGIPMEFETDNVKKPWLEQNFDTEKIFYYGESVLLKAYRGRGIGVQFFKHRENWVKELNRFNLITFCGVVRPSNHPLKPDDYHPLDDFWEKRGFVKTKNLVCRMNWKDINEETESQKLLHFWYKNLSV
ncbi:MAG: GNAT family N-acetyltransferase [Saprospiraceae bacterium]|nr:GNAT family N-acetyltransferase [Saprospiraceae bacterium]